MNQKVICDRAFVCEESNGCEHSEPHFPKIFDSSTYSKRPDFTCVELDQCLDYEVRCIPIGIDFELEGMFSL